MSQQLEEVNERQEERQTLFTRFADAVSFHMGTPKNIGFWLLAVAAWFALGPWIAGHQFLPSWFTSNAFNFPLNTVTTLAELYIGFLVAAASNRAERHLRELLAGIGRLLEEVTKKQDAELQEIEKDEQEELAILERLDRQDRQLLAIVQHLGLSGPKGES